MFKKILSAVLTVAIVSLTVPDLSADGDGCLENSFYWKGHGGLIAKGVGTWEECQGAMTIRELPQGSDLIRAFLYWGCVREARDRDCFFNDSLVTGQQIGTDGPYTCFRADVTRLFTGNNEYAVSGLHVDVQGFSLVVIYSQPKDRLTRIVINDGCDCNGDGGGWQWMTPTYFGDFVRPDSFSAAITYIVGEGQPEVYDSTTFMDTTLALNGFDGSDGSRWDTDTYDVTELLTGEILSPYANIYEGSDHLGWCAAIFTLGKIPIISAEDDESRPSLASSLGIVSVYPNPFNNSTSIVIESSGRFATNVDIYNVAGVRVRRLQALPAGEERQTARWDATDDGGKGVPSGVYFCKLSSEAETVSKKLLYVK
jgi:hypothetical protein